MKETKEHAHEVCIDLIFAKKKKKKKKKKREKKE
jgi:hypothetical protein